MGRVEFFGDGMTIRIGIGVLDLDGAVGAGAAELEGEGFATYG